jgi:hypothetical protein
MNQENLKKEILELLQDKSRIDALTASMETPGQRYCHSMIVLLSRENKELYDKFLGEYTQLIRGKSTPIFKVSIVLDLYRKWLRYPIIIKEIHFISKNVKAKSIDVDFWSQFIMSTAVDKPMPELQTARLNLLICLFNSKTLNVEDCSKYGIIMDTILKLKIHHDDFHDLKGRLKQNDHPYHRMFFLIQQFIALKISNLELAELLNIHFSTPDRTFNCSEQVKEFYQLLVNRLPTDYPLKLKKMDVGKLFHIYKLCPRLFDNLEIDIQMSLSLEMLIQILFKDYMFSGVLLKAFSTAKITSIEMNWFNDELSGKNIIYSDNLPFTVTKKAAHHFRCLPFTLELSVTRALIYSSFCSAGVDEQFAMVASRSIRSLEHASYWIETLTLLHKKGLRSVNLREVMDYLNEKVIIQGEKINLKGKSVRNLLVEIDQWHEQIRFSRILKRVGAKKLAESEIETYFTDHDGESFMIKQIKRTNELFYEGEYLHHCVYTYRRYCMDGSTFIFSLRKIDENAAETPLITIEVVSNEIRQMKGKFNRLPSYLERELIQIWARDKQLRLAC